MEKQLTAQEKIEVLTKVKNSIIVHFNSQFKYICPSVNYELLTIYGLEDNLRLNIPELYNELVYVFKKYKFLEITNKNNEFASLNNLRINGPMTQKEVNQLRVDALNKVINELTEE